MADEAAAGIGESGSGDIESAIASGARELAERRKQSAPVTEVGYTGRNAPESVSLKKAGEDLGEHRRKTGEQEDPGPVPEVKYPKDDPKYDARTPREAAADLAEYRDTKAADIRAQIAATLDGIEAENKEAAAAEQPAEPAQQPPEAAQQEQPPQKPSEIFAKAVELIKSENPAERASALEMITKAAQEVDTKNHAVHSAVVQAYGNATQNLESIVAAQLLAEWGSVDPSELAQKDPAAFQRLQKMANVHRALAQHTAAQRAETDRLAAQQWQSWAAQQDAITLRNIPEAADPKFQGAVSETLRGYGFSPDELAAAYSGQRFTMRDARVARIVADATKYRQATAAGLRPAPKPLPAVQRPGVTGLNHPSEATHALNAKLSRTGSLKDAAALLSARRANGRSR